MFYFLPTNELREHIKTEVKNFAQEHGKKLNKE